MNRCSQLAIVAAVPSPPRLFVVAQTLNEATMAVQKISTTTCPPW
jgi:hypothetical protein